MAQSRTIPEALHEDHGTFPMSYALPGTFSECIHHGGAYPGTLPSGSSIFNVRWDEHMVLDGPLELR
ncbi:hypothetical protein Hypma_003980 [Hypsizygus marmoreus]|uniref:Uncharacterized protein n=1 Tax=Hypsizygus marmoreus TaxID=39966 RepID=A0A369J126_HYPMA|nr:hypothetical protein Hypma_003980 [Hypsizygus marmoreus]